MIPRTFLHQGKWFDRVTIRFAGGKAARQSRAYVQDVLIRTHGYPTIRRLTDALAAAGGRFQLAVARSRVKALRRRLRLLIDAGLVDVWVRGQRVI